MSFGSVVGKQRMPCGYQKITSPSAATALTAPTLGKPNLAVITTETQNIRIRDDGSDPTSTDGQLVKTTDPPLEYRGNLAVLKLIQTAANATVHVSYYQETVG